MTQNIDRTQEQLPPIGTSDPTLSLRYSSRAASCIYGSPLYVYQLDRLLDTIDHITNSIPYPGTQFQFASVTNGNVALLQVFKNKNWGIHANTPGDIHLALAAGFTPDRIVYSGSNLDRAEMRQVLSMGDWRD